MEGPTSLLQKLVDGLICHQHELQSHTIQLESRLADVESSLHKVLNPDTDVQAGSHSLLLSRLEMQMEKVETRIQEMETRMTGMSEQPKPVQVAEESQECRKSTSSWFRTEGTDLEVKLSSTAWEGVMIAFYHAPGFLTMVDSLSFAMAAFLNIFIQLLCIAVIFSLFLESELPTLDEVSTWRNAYAHDHKQVVDSSFSSLASAVCNSDESLIVSTGQQQTLKSIRKYVDHLEFFGQDTGFKIGHILCILMIFYWFHIIFKELCRILDLITTVKLSRHTTISHHEGDGISFELVQVGICRYVAFAILLVFRLVVAGSLLLAGSLWLAYTVSPKDILLNSVSLAFILDIDELLFENLATLQSKNIVENLRPLRRSSSGIGDTQGTILAVVLSTVFLIVMSSWKIGKTIADMVDIEETMCGLPLDFIAGRGSYGLVYIQETKPFVPHITTLMMSVIGQYIADGSSDAFAHPSSYQAFLEDINKEPLDKNVWFGERVLSNSCVDLLPSPPGYSGMLSNGDNKPALLLVPLSFQFPEVWNLTSCAQLKDYCMQDDATLLRASCPETCGCSDPMSGLYLDGILTGCVTNLCRKSSAYVQALQDRPCQDMSGTALNATPGWHNFWNGYLHAKGDNGRAIRTAEELKAQGCPGLRNFRPNQKEELCVKDDGRSSLAMFCPKACSCKASVEGCPSTCSEQEQTEEAPPNEEFPPPNEETPPSKNGEAPPNMGLPPANSGAPSTEQGRPG